MPVEFKEIPEEALEEATKKKPGRPKKVKEEEGEKKVEALVEETKNSNNSKSSKEEKTSKKVFISIDNTIEDIIKYQSEGVEIFFKDDPEDFLPLSQEEISQLNSINRTRYTIACGVRYQTLNLSDLKDSKKFFKPRPGFASATQRLTIKGGRPDMHYAWKRPDELQQYAYEGGRVCTDPNVRTFGGVDADGKTVRGSSTKTVSANGVDELILCEMPKERKEARDQAIAEKSIRRNKAVEATAMAELKAAGGQPFREKD